MSWSVTLDPEKNINLKLLSYFSCFFSIISGGNCKLWAWRNHCNKIFFKFFVRPCLYFLAFHSTFHCLSSNSSFLRLSVTLNLECLDRPWFVFAFLNVNFHWNTLKFLVYHQLIKTYLFISLIVNSDLTIVNLSYVNCIWVTNTKATLIQYNGTCYSMSQVSLATASCMSWGYCTVFPEIRCQNISVIMRTRHKSDPVLWWGKSYWMATFPLCNCIHSAVVINIW